MAALTFGGRVHVEWNPAAPVTPLGQLPFFIEYLRLGGLFDPWVADCPLGYTSPTAPKVSRVCGQSPPSATLSMRHEERVDGSWG